MGAPKLLPCHAGSALQKNQGELLVVVIDSMALHVVLATLAAGAVWLAAICGGVVAVRAHAGLSSHRRSVWDLLLAMVDEEVGVSASAMLAFVYLGSAAAPPSAHQWVHRCACACSPVHLP